MEGNNNILDRVHPGRREFVKRLIAGVSFTAPVIATFSIESLTANPALAANTTNPIPFPNTTPPNPNTTHPNPNTINPNPNQGCQVDDGYVGPGSFNAHLSLTGIGPLKTRVNGEATFSVVAGANSAATTISTTLAVTHDVVMSSGEIHIGGKEAATMPLGATGTLIAADLVLSVVCDMDELLEEMAAGACSLEVKGTYLGQSLTISGPIVAGSVNVVQIP